MVLKSTKKKKRINNIWLTWNGAEEKISRQKEIILLALREKKYVFRAETNEKKSVYNGFKNKWMQIIA